MRFALQVIDVTADQSVADVSKQMLQEPKRHNYVTPTKCLETVRGYRCATLRCRCTNALLACTCLPGTQNHDVMVRVARVHCEHHPCPGLTVKFTSQSECPGAAFPILGSLMPME